MTVNQLVAGSNPALGAMQTKVQIDLTIKEALILSESLNSTLEYLQSQGFLPLDLNQLPDNSPLTLEEIVCMFNLREKLNP